MFHSSMKFMTAGVVLVGFLLPGCVTASKYYTAKEELDKTSGDLLSTEAQLRDAENALVTIRDTSEEWAQEAEKAAQLEELNAKLQQEIAALKEKAAAASIDGFMTFVNVEEGMYGYRAQADVFFAPGNATLTKEGRARLLNLVPELKKHKYPIRVVGHTDADPIRKTKDKWPLGNIQLGAHRAIAVQKFLVENGIGEARLSIQSYGPFQPVAPGKSAEAKERNRRVEIMVKVVAGG